jgi:DMSO/TMAO reductase YedYZ molybdopterin-dependent catalytic subunit
MISRRRLLTSGLGAIAGASGLAVAARLAASYGLVPPDHGGVFGVGETLTYGAHRLLTWHQPLAREFDRAQISRVAPVNGDPPESDEYQRLVRRNFAEWRLEVDGLVARPSSFSLAELKRLPSRSHITHQACEEGWSFIAEWTGVPLSEVLARVGISTRARYIVFYPFDTFWDSLDLADAWHPQTLLAYGMNGRELPTGHGAPVRLRVTRQLGYKSIKFLSRISAVETLADIGDGRGAAAPAYGYSWYAGI